MGMGNKRESGTLKALEAGFRNGAGHQDRCRGHGLDGGSDQSERNLEERMRGVQPRSDFDWRPMGRQEKPPQRGRMRGAFLSRRGPIGGVPVPRGVGMGNLDGPLSCHIAGMLSSPRPEASELRQRTPNGARSTTALPAPGPAWRGRGRGSTVRPRPAQVPKVAAKLVLPWKVTARRGPRDSESTESYQSDTQRVTDILDNVSAILWGRMPRTGHRAPREERSGILSRAGRMGEWRGSRAQWGYPDQPVGHPFQFPQLRRALR